ncbi:hypothetical protein HCX48_09500 [Rhodocyclus tenuis]|uniref:Uncharacterized protein n=2 Tax=Rhodocyclus TaxID=1064 RepID=A0A6L5JZW7_RHOTE|nr:hypothetical protein [Rhodocyclus gracilis]MQY52110.1 hypothetical protein [Rhodocyclus gracilis]NJA89454.1 hypothetical protein [Rhodocyclus gracilis]
MFEAYKVAIRLSLINNVSSGLTAISMGLMSTQKHIDKANAGLMTMEIRLAQIKRSLLIGGAMTGAGAGILMGFKGPFDQAVQWEREAAKLRQMGIGEAQIRDAQKFVQANTIIGTSMQQRMRLFAEAQGSFRESGMDGERALEAAKTMMPVMAQYETAMKLLGGPHMAMHEMAMRNLNKTVEIMGGIGHPKRAEEIADGVFKAVQSSGKMVDERQLKQFVAYGSSATNSLSMRAIFGGLEPIIGEFGGSTVATGLRTAFTRMSGGMALPPKKMQSTLAELGIGKIDHGQVRMTDGLLRLMQSDTVEFTKQLMEIYKTHGIASQLDRERTNALLFNTTGAKIYNKLMQQMPVIEESLLAYDKARGIAQTNRDNAKSPMMAIEKFHAAMDDLGLVVGKTVLPVLTPLIKDLSKFFETLQRFPLLVKGLTYGFVGLGAAMAISGTILLTKTAFKSLGLVLGASGGLGANLKSVAGGLKSVGLQAAAFMSLYAGWKIGDVVGDKIDQSVQKSSGGAHGSLRSYLDQTWLGKSTGWFKYGQDESLHFQQAPSSNYVRSKAQQQPKMINNTIVMPDGRVLYSVVTQEMDKDLRRPMAGTSRPDGRMSLTPVGASGR